MPWLALIVIVGVVAAIVLMPRVGEIFCISVRQGQVLVVRGHVRGGFLGDVADVVRKEKVQRATIRAVRGDGHAVLEVSGLAAGPEQRLRNCFAMTTAASLSAPRVSERTRRNVGQILGIVWLAWLLDRR